MTQYACYEIHPTTMQNLRRGYDSHGDPQAQ